MANKTLSKITIQHRNDVKATWESKNPVLAKGEMGVEIDTRKFKFGNGVDAWNDLEYSSSEEIIIDAVLSATSENPVQNKVINEAVHYTNDTPTITAIGGVATGSTFNNVPITEMLTKILYPYTKPTVSVSVTPNGGTYEKGTSVAVTALKATVTKKSSPIASVTMKQNSTVITTLTDGVANGGTLNMLPSAGVSLTADTTFSATATDTDNGSTSANSTKFTFVDPYYTGVIADGTTVTGDTVTSLTKKVEAKGTKSYSYTTSGQCMVIAYPKSYGVLKSALDPNGFENIASYTRHEVNVTTASGASVAYYVYVKTASTVTDFVIKYSY